MRSTISSLALLSLAANLATAVPVKKPRWQHPAQDDYLVSLGVRPYYLVQNMTDGPLKQQLEACFNKPVEVTGWSIGHRGGGTLQIPEETSQSIEAGARMGAGVLECDVSFTKDLGLVCRHDICDLHTTTDILTRPDLAAKVSRLPSREHGGGGNCLDLSAGQKTIWLMFGGIYSVGPPSHQRTQHRPLMLCAVLPTLHTLNMAPCAARWMASTHLLPM
jgi:hypothetical protein